MIKDALYAVTHGQDLSYDLAKDTMNKIMSGEVAEVPMAGFLCGFHKLFHCSKSLARVDHMFSLLNALC